MVKSDLNPLVKTFIWPAVVLVIALGAFYFKPWQQNTNQTISVITAGTATAKPDVAKITATVEIKNPNIEQARAQNAEAVDKIITATKALGIEDKDIKTQNISAGESYQTLIYPPRQPDINQFSTSLEITIRNFEIADKVISTLTQNGATNLYGPNLTYADETLEAAKSQAREKAVDMARQKAQKLAKVSDRNLGKVISIKEQGDYGIPGPIYALGGADLQEKASQIQPGQDEITITLQIDFSLK